MRPRPRCSAPPWGRGSPTTGVARRRAGSTPSSSTTWRRHGLVHERVVEIVVLLRPAPGRAAAGGRRLAGGAPRAAQRAALAWLAAEGPSDSAAALARDAGVPPSAARALVAKGYAGYADLPRPVPASVPWVTTAPAPPFDLDLGSASMAGRPGAVPDRCPPGDGARRAAERGAAERLLLSGGDAKHGVGRRPSDWLRAGGRARAPRRWSWCPRQATGGGAGAAPSAPSGRRCAGAPTSTTTSRAAAAAELAAGHVAAVVVGTYPALALDAPAPGGGCWCGTRRARAPTSRLAGARSVARQRRARARSGRGRGVGPGRSARRPPSCSAIGSARSRRCCRGVAPRAVLLDLRSEPGWPLSASLVRLLRQVAERGRQAVVVSVPRRGYAAALGCRTCGEFVMCPNCDLPLRWHQRAGPAPLPPLRRGGRGRPPPVPACRAARRSRLGPVPAPSGWRRRCAACSRVPRCGRGTAITATILARCWPARAACSSARSACLRLPPLPQPLARSP
jgi:primosomal protein N' (replication factor Y) (superfamily II helicase)